MRICLKLEQMAPKIGEMARLTCWFLQRRDLVEHREQRLVTLLYGGALNLMKFAWWVASTTVC